MAQLFTPSTPLELLVHGADYNGVLDYLRPLSVAERQRHRASVARMLKLIDESTWRGPEASGLVWDTAASKEQWRSVGAAALLCGTAEDAATSRMEFDYVLALSKEFEIPCLSGLADALLRRSPYRIHFVQDLIAAGVVVRPDSEDYALGLIYLPGQQHPPTALAERFAADPGLRDAVLRIFDIQGTTEDSLASAEKYTVPVNSWRYHLLAMTRDGFFDRATLLHKTLSALEQDWPQYRASWFSRFHKDLAPTTAELQVNAARYLQLCHSRIPPTVSLALDALGQLESKGQIDAAALLAALRPVMSGGSKGQVEAALKLMDRCVAHNPGFEVEAALLTCSALVLDSAALQAKLLQRLSRQSANASVREAMRRHLPGMAASNRGTMLKLLGEAEESVPAAKAVQADSPDGPRASAVGDERRLAPVADLDELIQLIAYVFENDTDTDAFERAMSGLVAMAPFSPGDAAQFSPVLKRAAKMQKPVAVELARLLVFAMQGARLSVKVAMDYFGDFSEVHRRLIARAEALMDLLEQGKRLAPLSSPTHRRGAIAPADLIDRALAYQARGVRTSVAEQALAILRLAGPANDADRQRLRGLTDSPFVCALRYALADDVVPGKERELFCAAARIRHLRSDDVALLASYGDLGPDGPRAARYSWEVSSRSAGDKTIYWYHDLKILSAARPSEPGDLLAVARHPMLGTTEAWGSYSSVSLAGDDAGMVAYSATLMPSDLEAFFAEGARGLGNNIDWSQACWHHKRYLEPLLDPTVVAGPMAVLMLVCALGGKEPGQAALAVDGLVQLRVDGRLDVAMLSATLRRLLATPMVKPTRYRKQFDSALRIDPGLAMPLIEVLSTAVTVNPEAPARDISQLLELLHELLVQTGQVLSTEAKQEIAEMKPAGQGKALQEKLLAM